MYNKKVIDHFLNPRNTGCINEPDGVGVFGDPSCGDYLCIYIKVDDNHISDIKFEIRGCPAAIATSSILTELAKGKSIKEAEKITDEDIIRALGELPEPKIHCSNLGAKALQQAIKDYLTRQEKIK